MFYFFFIFIYVIVCQFLIDNLHTAVRIPLLFITDCQLFHQQQKMVRQTSVYVYIKSKNGTF